VENGGFVEQNSFHVFEDRRASVELIGRITAANPVPDAGSTLALMAIAIAGLGGLRQYLTARA
jgi:VPDSG-CTERM motif